LAGVTPGGIYPAAAVSGRESRSDGPGGRDRQQSPLLHPGQLPAALVDHPVVAVAEQDEIRNLGLASVTPVHEVVGVGEGHRTVAAGPLAAPGACAQRRARRRTGQAQGAADVDHRGVGAEQDAADPGIAGEPLHGGGGTAPANSSSPPVAPSRPITVSTRGGELEVGAHPAGGRHRPEVERVAGDLHHRISEAPSQGR